MAVLQHSASQSSLGTGSAHSQDLGPGVQTVEIKDATATVPNPSAIAERAVRGAGEAIKKPVLDAGRRGGFGRDVRQLGRGSQDRAVNG